MNKSSFTKDELRVRRSIESICSKIEISMRRSNPDFLEREEQFRKKVESLGLIYFYPKSFNL